MYQCKMLKCPQPRLLASIAAPTARNGVAIAKTRKRKVLKMVIVKFVNQREQTEYSWIFFGPTRFTRAKSPKIPKRK